jgi:hypothetical protein
VEQAHQVAESSPVTVLRSSTQLIVTTVLEEKLVQSAARMNVVFSSFCQLVWREQVGSSPRRRQSVESYSGRRHALPAREGVNRAEH